MASSPVAICNSALIKIGAERITNLTDDTKEARLCNEQYEKMRDEVLASHFWNFAMERIELAQLTDTPEFGYRFYYAIPSNVLRIKQTQCEDDEWFRETYDNQDVLITDLNEVKILAITQVTNTTLFSKMFDDALAWRIAAEICYAITQNATLADATYARYERALSYARTYDAQEGTPLIVKANQYKNVRR